MILKVCIILFGIFVASKASCPDKKYNRIPGHTACLEASDDVTESGVSEDDKKVIVDEHNKIRRNVPQTASNMLKMSWDDEIAMIAQKWASTCKGGHDDGFKRMSIGRYRTGQNTAKGYADWKAAVLGWGKEIANFNYGVASNKVYGHYTQQIWANTNKIGCGYAKCGSANLFVCNYAPVGNIGRNADEKATPYKLGASCGDCSANCDDKLCDCTNTECLNFGTLNVGSCECACYKGLAYSGATCALDCDTIKDSKYCGGFFTVDKCSKWANTPFYCPKMCGMCPASTDEK